MDREAVASWYQQGLLDDDSQVLVAGATRWRPLSAVMELKPLRGAERRKKAAPKRAEKEPLAPLAPAQRWRTILAGALFMALAAGAGSLAYFPRYWLPALAATPWREIALALAVSGLLLVRGWMVGRRIVRAIVLLAGVALVSVVGILVASGMRGRALLVLLAGLALLAGFLALLSSGWLPWTRITAALLLTLGGTAGIGYFGVVVETPEQRSVRESIDLGGVFADAALGVTLQAPGSWRVLRRGQTVIPAPPGAAVVLARPGAGGFAFLAAEASPRGIVSLDGYLERAFGLQQGTTPLGPRSWPADVRVDGVAGRVAGAPCESNGVRCRDLIGVWKSGWTYFRLVARVPDDGVADPAEELESLLRGITLDKANATRLTQAVEAATREVPLVSAPAAELILGAEPAHSLEAGEILRRALAFALRGRSALTAAEAQEMAELVSTTYDLLPPRERNLVTRYLERARAGQRTTPEEDREMSQILKQALLLRLTSERLRRVQELHEKAIRAALAGEAAARN
jgi:hypothetical protein